MDIKLKEMREPNRPGQAEIKSTINVFQEKINVLIANRKNDQKN
jgi:hypothetical protein